MVSLDTAGIHNMCEEADNHEETCYDITYRFYNSITRCGSLPAELMRSIHSNAAASWSAVLNLHLIGEWTLHPRECPYLGCENQ